MNLTVSYFLGIINKGVSYWDCYPVVNTIINTKQWIYLRNTSLFVIGTG